jgi:hypothetical protein
LYQHFDLIGSYKESEESGKDPPKGWRAGTIIIYLTNDSISSNLSSGEQVKRNRFSADFMFQLTANGKARGSRKL